MAQPSVLDSPIWEQFQKVARARRRNPVQLLNDYMRECLEIWEDQQLDQDIQKEARPSGYNEDDAVNIVRQHRQEIQNPQSQINPWMAMHGRLRNDPAFDDVMAEIETFRRQVNDKESTS